MDFTYNASEFNLERFFSILRDQYKFEDGVITEDIYCKNSKDLRREGGIIICCLDIFRLGLPLEEYYKFSTHSNDRDSFEEDEEEEKTRILAMAQENGWVPDDGLNMAISGEEIGVAIKVSLDREIVKLEPGLVKGDPETSSDTFYNVSGFGMPEINKMIQELIGSCVLT